MRKLWDAHNQGRPAARLVLSDWLREQGHIPMVYALSGRLFDYVWSTQPHMAGAGDGSGSEDNDAVYDMLDVVLSGDGDGVGDGWDPEGLFPEWDEDDDGPDAHMPDHRSGDGGYPPMFPL